MTYAQARPDSQREADEAFAHWGGGGGASRSLARRDLVRFSGGGFGSWRASEVVEIGHTKVHRADVFLVDQVEPAGQSRIVTSGLSTVKSITEVMSEIQYRRDRA